MVSRVHKLCILSVFWLASWTCGATTYYVATNSPSDGPGTSWTNAYHEIQSAIDSPAVVAGDTVLVSNGTYNTGGKAVSVITNRVTIDKAITVRSLMGPEVTIIEGVQPKGTNAIRCAYVGSGAVLSGFTLTNGATRIHNSDAQGGGGGVYCGHSSAVVSNCIIVGNAAHWAGGGAFSGRLYSCTLRNNTSLHCGGGSKAAIHYNCSLIGNYCGGGGGGDGAGGGAFGGLFYNCTISSNSGQYGGGVCGDSFNVGCMLSNCVLTANTGLEGNALGGGVYAEDGQNEIDLYNCLLSGNSAGTGGGVNDSGSACRMFNCTVSSNSASGQGGGAVNGVLINCIVYSNAAASSNNVYNSVLRYSCTTPAAAGDGNIINAPMFQDWANGNYRLQVGSPCIDTGTNLTSLGLISDLDGIPRPLDGDVDGSAAYDMGCYEVVHPTADTDNDRLSDADELVADTSPTDINSLLAFVAITPVGTDLRVTWQGGVQATQFVERSNMLTTNPANWITIFTNLPPTAPSTNFLDTAATNDNAFYRIRITGP